MATEESLSYEMVITAIIPWPYLQDSMRFFGRSSLRKTCASALSQGIGLVLKQGNFTMKCTITCFAFLKEPGNGVITIRCVYGD